MTDRTKQLRRQVRYSQGVVDQVTGIARDAVKQDQAGRWGLDGWIRLIHNLLDLQMRLYASGVQAALAGPKLFAAPANDPLDPDPVVVPGEEHLRTFSIVKSFQRVGRPDIVIPDWAIDFEPDVLAPNSTQFIINVIDDKYIGANYTGTVRLRRADGVRAVGGPDSESLTITVGL
jgi:hypothetical protein